jgi:hypothetical protein
MICKEKRNKNIDISLLIFLIIFIKAQYILIIFFADNKFKDKKDQIKIEN